jgi:hypothetical protein
MNRILTLATSGIFAAGLAILPVSGFAQAASTTTDMKPATSVPTTTTDVKPTTTVTPKVVTHDAKPTASKDAMTAKDAGKSSAKTGGSHSSSDAPAPAAAPTGTAKTGSHGAS